ncbi:hypothetical protein F6R98_11310 [Candidatus Methylospira mobilis]|uniref:Uncharacterized protein n=1 Tax=Candidatus Methylospira mobilis TaxID=1808979 RepID=A0A5Q0BN11_9GAMM|nr:hypothetical protein [Candidatus Methylospira mobilis]QFY43136.1 hypothetical protein F6R98_11310 [Candidatus Methylospira mobilis]
MKFELPHRDSGYYPQVVLTLNGIPDEKIFHIEHGLMHPVDIFVTTFNDATESASRLTKRINSIILLKKENEDIRLEEIDDIRVDIFNFLFFSANFIEACQSIIKSLFEKNSKQAGKAAREFNGLTIEYRAHVSKIINFIKHQHRRIRPITGAWGNKIIVGYYVEGVVAANVIGPDPEVHPDSNSAISLNRDIPYHVVNLYFMCSCLDTIVRKHIKVAQIAQPNLDGNKIFSLLQEISKIPLNYFPNEINKSIPLISTHTSPSDRALLEYPGRKKAENRKPHNMNISLTSIMGVRSRSLKLPYSPIDS